MSTLQPKPIRTDGSNLFARRSFEGRIPSIILRVIEGNAYSADVVDRLNQFYTNVIEDAPFPLLELPADDVDLWHTALEERPGESWLNTDWFFAETFFFRYILEAVRYGKSQQDPYRFIKNTELSDVTAAMIFKALSDPIRSDQLLWNRLEGALWGNQADLSHPISLEKDLSVAGDKLLIDDRDSVIRRLHVGTGSVHIVTDNFGMELAADLLLVDTILSAKIPVIMHLKSNPTYVSDATVQDVFWMLEWLEKDLGNEAADLARRLVSSIETRQLRLESDDFWNSHYFLTSIPERIRKPWSEARLIILKGDANYRRAVNDTIYPGGTLFRDLTRSLRAPLVALRTLKSDPIVGLDAVTVASLDSLDSQWRTNGKRGIIQFASS